MSELLDKQVYVLNECFKYLHCMGVTQAHEKCAMKIKARKNDSRVKIFYDRKDFVWLFQKLDVTNFDELQVNNSSHTKGICLVNG